MGIKASTVRECILGRGESDPNTIDAVMTMLVEEGADNSQMWEVDLLREFVELAFEEYARVGKDVTAKTHRYNIADALFKCFGMMYAANRDFKQAEAAARPGDFRDSR